MVRTVMGSIERRGSDISWNIMNVKVYTDEEKCRKQCGENGLSVLGVERSLEAPHSSAYYILAVPNWIK